MKRDVPQPCRARKAPVPTKLRASAPPPPPAGVEPTPLASVTADSPEVIARSWQGWCE
jgi:hypothetical protein